ncbi:hypothetical protein BTO20_29935 [Mycobacterium dioxanotrophicus]|jgi:hypothetical protein|uniref:Uncharacterized protein n=1 Tax=Mycobacterium dioxanotrophicus TaxID=482462 RepID=A0A1Y0CB72_9MYCO|nr:hypothetical protein [Mycobacterium dioxanotrophicus]ART72215.1 hypothetical protein BTO20_29935 [Mycobacterium dioxanotrophicus]
MTDRLLRTVAGTVLSGAVAVVGLGLAPGIAHANGGPYTWCPGQSMDDPSGPNRYGTQYVWDMNGCHTWYRVSYGYGNVPRDINGQQTLQGSSAWDGEDPPVPEPVNCGLFWCPIPPHPDPNFHG